MVDHFPGASGVKAGMTLEQAVSYVADTVVLNADEPYYRQIFGEVIRSLQGISDRVEGGELGTAYVRLDGLESLFGGEERVVRALLDAVPADLKPRIGVADAKFPAFVAARMRAPGVSHAPAEVRGFLAPYSVELLPVAADVKSKLRRFGLHTMGEVAAMEEHLIVAQFGRDGSRLWALCNGIDDSPVIPTAFEESIVEEISLPFNSTSIELLLVAVDTLLRRGYARPELGGRLVGAAALQGSARGWPPWAVSTAFKQPVGRWEGAAALVRNRMELEPPQIPVEDVTLTLSDFRGGSGMQMGLFEDVKEEAGRRLMEMERRLQARMNGKHILHHIAEVAPWHPAPEMRAMQIPIDPAKRDDIRPLHAPTPVEVREGSARQPVAVQLGRRWRGVARIADRWTFDLWWLGAADYARLLSDFVVAKCPNIWGRRQRERRRAGDVVQGCEGRSVVQAELQWIGSGVRGQGSGAGDLCGGGGDGFWEGRFALSESGFAGFGDFQDGWRTVECWWRYPRRGAENILKPFDPRRAAEGRGEHLNTF